MKLYRTRDFYLAAFLYYWKCSLQSTEQEENVTVFNFEKTDKLKGLVAAYYKLKSKVEPMAYGQSVRTLKSVIWASKSDTSLNHRNNNYETIKNGEKM